KSFAESKEIIGQAKDSNLKQDVKNKQRKLTWDKFKHALKFDLNDESKIIKKTKQNLNTTLGLLNEDAKNVNLNVVPRNQKLIREKLSYIKKEVNALAEFQGKNDR